MSCDCEHLIRHMLVVDADKRYSLHQIKQHRWLALDGSNSGLQLKCDVACDPDSSCDPEDWDDCDFALVDWITRELGLDSSAAVMESITNRSYDHFYAMFHLLKDARGSCEDLAPPSPPLLPVVAVGQERKSSITTGFVARESSPTTPAVTTAGESGATMLSVASSGQRRHTFGPDGTAAPVTCSQTVFTPPLLFLTPPTGTPATHNLPSADPNYPISHMDLLKPPQVLLINNTGRRASDGQATYSSMCASSLLPSAMDTVREMPAPLTCAASTTIDSQASVQFVFPQLQQLHQQFLAASLSPEQAASAASTPSPPTGFGPLATPSPSPPFCCTPPPPPPYPLVRPRKRHSLTDAPDSRSRRTQVPGLSDRSVKLAVPRDD